MKRKWTIDDLRITGLDFSLSSPGIAHIESGKYVSSVSIKTDASDPWFLRVDRIARGTVDEVNQFRPDFIFIENYSFNSRFGRELAGEVHGVIRYALHKSGFHNQFRVIAPTQLKTYVTSNSKAKKKEMVEGINTLYGTSFKPSQNDQADALGIAMIGHELVLQECRTHLPLPQRPKNQQVVIQKAIESLRSDPMWLNNF